MGKITCPHLAEVFLRERLFGMLDRMRREPLIWISGPGGCGKTTLVGSYLEDRNIPCLWYQVDEGDKDPATFFYYLSLAAKRASPKKKTSLPIFTHDFSHGLSAFTRWYFERLFDLLNRSVPLPKNRDLRGKFILVFDNFHEVPEGSPLREGDALKYFNWGCGRRWKSKVIEIFKGVPFICGFWKRLKAPGKKGVQAKQANTSIRRRPFTEARFYQEK